MTTIKGKYGIKATILKDSISPQGIRFITYEIEYPRIILAEYNTHRMLAKNSSSSRAIPWAKMQESLTARPVRFGAANPGMQDKGTDHDARVYIHGEVFCSPEETWHNARAQAMFWADKLFEAGYHKQVYNRLVEPFQMMKTVTSGTEWANFFWLRHHEAADPTLAELARVMFEAREASKPELLQPGEWHLPYVDTYRGIDGSLKYGISTTDDPIWLAMPLTLEEARKVSAARCAAVSFRNVDYGVQKCLEVYDRLVGDDRKHASAFEHQGTPMEAEFHDLCGCCELNVSNDPHTWEQGITHMDRKGQLWSGPLKGWIQFRKLIPGENYEGEING